MSKPFYLSKTLWVNLLTGLALVFALPELHAILGPNAVSYVALGAAVVNIALRLVTATPISLT